MNDTKKEALKALREQLDYVAGCDPANLVQSTSRMAESCFSRQWNSVKKFVRYLWSYCQHQRSRH